MIFLNSHTHDVRKLCHFFGCTQLKFVRRLPLLLTAVWCVVAAARATAAIQMNAPPHNSLVKYDNAILVSTTQGKKGGRANRAAAKDIERQTTQTEDILNSILPPREWTNDGQLWVQYVSSTPATRLDVINLQVCVLEMRQDCCVRMQANGERASWLCSIAAC
jgi:Axonemal dynein light chain